MSDAVAGAATPAPDLFVQALSEDSNLELDWLWLFTQVVRECERRIALEHALQINPGNAPVRRELARLSVRPTAPGGARSLALRRDQPCEG